MRILLTGAQGFIGSQITSQLLQAGHEILAVVRKKSSTQKQHYEEIIGDFNTDITPDIWLPRLTNIDIVINCAGALREQGKNSLEAIHYLAPKALFTACQTAGIKKIIHFSALGADLAANTVFAHTKHAIENFIHDLDMDWIILRPSLVYGSGAYGGTALMRGLAALPFFIPVLNNSPAEFQPISLMDVAKATLKFVEKNEITRASFDLVGPERVEFKKILLLLRQWLGLSAAKIIIIPKGLATIAAKIGDWLGTGAFNTTALRMLRYGNTTSIDQQQHCYQAIGFIPRGFSENLLQMPSYVQDRWHARLYFLRPLLRFSLGLLWLGSGIVSLMTPLTHHYAILSQAGFSREVAPLVLYSAIVIDIILGLMMLFGWRVRQACLLQLATMLIYTLIASLKLSYLWLDPFAPLLKNIPIFIATLMMLAIIEER